MSMTWEGDVQTAPANEIVWPDFNKDNRAWAMAKAELGTNAPLHKLLALAQQIKGTL